MLPANAISSPSWKIGAITMCSGRWHWPRYGSLWTTTSPGSKKPSPNSSSVQRTVLGIAPIIEGV